MGLIVFLLIIILLILCVLFIPIILCIDTIKNQYYIQLRGLSKFSIEVNDDMLFKIKLKIFFFNFYLYPFKKNKPHTKIKKEEKEIKHKTSQKISAIRVLKIIRSFKVKKFYLDLDSGNCITNAKLYPLFTLLNRTKKGFKINFEGRNELVLYIQNRPINLIKSFVNF